MLSALLYISVLYWPLSFCMCALKSLSVLSCIFRAAAASTVVCCCAPRRLIGPRLTCGALNWKFSVAHYHKRTYYQCTVCFALFLLGCHPLLHFVYSLCLIIICNLPIFHQSAHIIIFSQESIVNVICLCGPFDFSHCVIISIMWYLIFVSVSFSVSVISCSCFVLPLVISLSLSKGNFILSAQSYQNHSQLHLKLSTSSECYQNSV